MSAQQHGPRFRPMSGPDREDSDCRRLAKGRDQGQATPATVLEVWRHDTHAQDLSQMSRSEAEVKAEAIKEYLSARMRKVSAAASGQSKRRGTSEYYSKLAKRRWAKRKGTP